MPFYPLNKLENENFERMKKTPGDIIILQLCTINDNIEWDMEWYIVYYKWQYRVRYGVIYPEIWSAMDRICCCFGPFFAFLPL